MAEVKQIASVDEVPIDQDCLLIFARARGFSFGIAQLLSDRLNGVYWAPPRGDTKALVDLGRQWADHHQVAAIYVITREPLAL